MKVLGFRTAPTKIRYAIISFDGTNYNFENSNSENVLNFPTTDVNIERKMSWLFQELERILRQNSDINSVYIKTNEYGRGETSTSREAAYLDSVVLLYFAQNNIPVRTVLNRTIGTNRSEVKNFASLKVGTTNTNWNEQIADAVSAGIYGIGG